MIDVLITDVTRMRSPNICVAGYTGDKCIRLDSPSPKDDLLSSSGGLKPGDVIRLHWRPKAGPIPPHVEDGEWRASSLRRIRRTGLPDFTSFLEARALSSVREAFGSPKLIGKGGNGAFPTGQGDRSLASIVASNIRVRVQYNRPRVDFTDGSESWRNVPLEDLVIHRHQESCSQCRSRPEQMLAGELSCDRAVIRIGLGRPFASDDHPAACWLQVNGIYPVPPKRSHFI